MNAAVAALSRHASSQPSLVADWMLMLQLGAETPASALRAAEAMADVQLGTPDHLQRLLLHALATERGGSRDKLLKAQTQNTEE